MYKIRIIQIGMFNFRQLMMD